MHSELALFSISKLEQGRVKEKTPDPRNLSLFSGLDEIVGHSLKPAQLVQMQTPSGNPLVQPKLVKRPFEDEALLKRLLQFRDQIPTSSRIIRAEET